MDSTAPRRTMSGKRASIQPLDVRRILTDQGALEPSPLPAEHAMCPNSPSTSTKSASSSRSFQSHGRTMSIAAESMGSGNNTPARTNRFSLTFPVQPATREQSPTRLSMSPRREGAFITPESLASPTGPTDSSFLTAIAAQERKVLELKEEWQRAEADLDKLKRQWANHEAHKKKNDARRVTKLQPLSTTIASPSEREDDGDGSSAWVQQEMERRKALLNGAKTSNRTVFSGSRHTRTLSLLSPVSNTTPASFANHPPRQDSLLAKQSLDRERPPPPRPSMLSRASTTPDMTTEVAETVDEDINLAQANVDRELLIKTGKKMATDFKEGLWTFWEDLRQATVGDEATQIAQPNMRRQSSAQTLKARRDARRVSPKPSSSRGSSVSKGSTETTKRPSSRSPVNRRQSPAKLLEDPPLVDVGGTFWTEAGLSAPGTTPATVKKSHKHSKTLSTAPSTGSSTGDAWDTWDEVSPQESRSSSATSHTTSHNEISPRNSYNPGEANGDSAQVGKKEPLPWPQLSKLGPANLRRTASHLMNEWERSMTPSPGQEFRGNAEDYMGLGPEATAVTPGKRD